MIGELLSAGLKAATGVKGYLILGACSVALGAAGGGWTAWKIQDARYLSLQLADARHEAAALKDAADKAAKATSISATVGAKVDAAVAKNNASALSLLPKVSTYVSKDAVDRCVIPAGFVRLDADAAAGLGATAAPAAKPDDAPSAVDLTDVADADVVNATNYRNLSAQVIGWQAFYTQLRANASAPPSQ